MARPKNSRKAASQRKPPLTHFLCLPLVTAVSKPQLESSLREFRAIVLPQASAREGEHPDPIPEPTESGGTDLPILHPKAIRPVGALHCTLGVMSLSKDELSRAVDLLQSLDVLELLADAGTIPISSSEAYTDNTNSTTILPSLHRPISPPPTERSLLPLRINLKGLESMPPSHKTSILYIAPADSSARLYPFCLAVQQRFKNEGLLVAHERPLKLHATVVNTIYAKGRKRGPEPTQRAAGLSDFEPQAKQAGSNLVENARSGVADHSSHQPQDDNFSGHGPNANPPLKINATALLERFKDFVWAEGVTLDRIAICEMGAKKMTDIDRRLIGEAYREVACVSLPS